MQSCCQKTGYDSPATPLVRTASGTIRPSSGKTVNPMRSTKHKADRLTPASSLPSASSTPSRPIQKARVGRATQLESQQVDETEITDDIYGVTGDGEKVDTTTGEIIQEKQDFAPQTDTSAGVTVDPAANDDDDTF